jgi:long-chain fatty acid transport protein
MNRSIARQLCLVLVLALVPATMAMATNGDNLIAIGPNARAMGGTGIAQPQDAISAVFANPAAMCFGAYCPSSELNFAGTLFMPHVDAKITTASGEVSADSEDQVYAIPAIGLSVPIGSGPSNWRFGLAAYGVTGLGVDYRGTEIDNPGFYDFGAGSRAPLVAGEYTQLQIMKFAPSVAFQPSAKLSLGLALHIDYATLDLRDGGSSNYGWGVQPGLIFKPLDHLSLGLTYTSPQSVDHDDVSDLDGDGANDTLTLESPQQLGFGAAYELLGDKLLIEADVKWINWSDADGYRDFDWNDQWVFALGAQVQPITGLFLRAGYNYGKNPVEDHDGWNGSFNPATGFPNSIQRVQGKTLPTYYYETFRIIGFPAVVEHHLTLGMGYQFTPKLLLNLGYMHAFSNSIEENGTDPFGRPVTLKSTLSEDSLDFGITWRF